MFDNEDHFTEHLATPGEADREYARNVGMDNPQRAWILSDRDVWYPNPSYVGPFGSAPGRRGVLGGTC
jgi:hypothetical protein